MPVQPTVARLFGPDDPRAAAYGAVTDAERLPTHVLIGGAEDLHAIAGYNVHRGCLALVERPEARAVGDVLSTGRTLVVLEGVTNPDNVGGVFRNAAALRRWWCSAEPDALRSAVQKGPSGRRWGGHDDCYLSASVL